MLTFTLSGWNWVKGQIWTNPALRKAFGGLTISASGTIATGDISAGAITPALVSPGAYFYSTSTYGAKTYVVSLTPILTGLANGVRVAFKAAADSEDGPINLTVNSLGPRKILRAGGIGLVAGDIRANAVVEVTYNTSLDGGVGAWEITSLVGNPEVFQGTSQGSSTGSAHVVSCAIPAKSFTALANRILLYVATVENTGALTLNVDTLGVKDVLVDDGQPLKRGYIKIGDVVSLVYSPTANAGAGAYLFRGARPSIFAGVDAGANDSYAVTIPSFPAAWVTGLVVTFKANTANTDACTLTVTPQGGSALSAVTLKRKGADLNTNDILAGQWVQGVFDGTNLEVLNVGRILTTAEQVFPSVGATLSVPHGFAAPPRLVRWVMVCKTADAGFAVGDEVDLFSFVSNAAGNPYPNNWNTWADATNMKAKLAVAFDTVTSANWRLKAYYQP